MDNSKKTALLGAVLLLIGGCNASAGIKATLPDGETDLSCATLLYAAMDLQVNDRLSGKDSAGMGDYLAVITKYGTAYAESNGFGADEALARIRIQAFLMNGKLPGTSVIPTESIVRRAKACAGW